MKNKLFSYRLLVYAIGRPGGGPADSFATNSSNPEVNREVRAQRLMLRGRLVGVRTSTKTVLDGLSWPTARNKGTLRALRAKATDIYESFMNECDNCANKDAVTKLAQKKIDEMNKLNEIMKNIERADVNRTRIKEVIFMHAQKINVSAMEEYYSVNKKHVELKHVKMLALSYIGKFLKANWKALKMMSDKSVNLMVLDINQSTKMFTRGPIVADHRAINSSIRKAIGRWEDSNPRKVYSNNEWDTKWEKKLKNEKEKQYMNKGGIVTRGAKKVLKYSLIANDFATKVAIGPTSLLIDPLSKMFFSLKGEKPMTSEELDKVMKFAHKAGVFPPTPDWGIKGKNEQVTSDLTNSNLMTPYLSRIEKLYGHFIVAQRMHQRLSGAGSQFAFGKISQMPNKNFKFPVMSKGKTVAFITIGVNGAIELTDAKGKNKVDIKGIAGKPNEVIKKIESLALQPKVQGFEVNIVGGRVQLLVKGEGLTSKAVKVEPGKYGVNLVSMPSGKVTLSGLALTKDLIDKKVQEQIKDSISHATIKPQAVKDQLLKKLGASTLKEVKDKFFKSQEKPELEIIGTASIVGSLRGNQVLARRRSRKMMTELKRKGIDKIYKLVSRYHVIGPDGRNVTDINGAWRGFAEMYQKVKPKQKNLTIAQMKKAVSDYNNNRGTFSPEQKDFLETHFKGNRGVHLSAEAPKGNAKDFDIAFQNNPAGSSTTTTPI